MAAEVPPQLPEALLQAAADCVQRLGLDKTSMDELAQASGLSRATLYRRYGRREVVLERLLIERSRPYVAPALQQMAGLGGQMAQRIEEGLVFAVLEMTTDPCLSVFYRAGQSPAVLAMIRNAYETLFADQVQPSTREQRLRGELRDELPFDEMMNWHLGQFLRLAMEGPWEEAALRRHVRHFIVPVLVPDHKRQPAALLETLAQQLALLQQTVQQLRSGAGGVAPTLPGCRQ